MSTIPTSQFKHSKKANDDQDFSLSFLIYLVITFLVNLYQTTGIIGASTRIANNEEEGYTKLEGNHLGLDGEETSSAEMFELTEQDLDSGDEDAVKIGAGTRLHEEEDGWMDPDSREMKSSVRI
jgi:hypothetical protein